MAEVGLPIMVQDAPLSGVDLSVPLLVRMAREIEMVTLFKIECPQAARRSRALSTGEEAITLLADLDAGPSAAYARVLPAVNHENRQCGFRAAKAAMVEGGVTRAMLIDLLRPLDPVVLSWGQ